MGQITPILWGLVNFLQKIAKFLLYLSFNSLRVNISIQHTIWNAIYNSYSKIRVAKFRLSNVLLQHCGKNLGAAACT